MKKQVALFVLAGLPLFGCGSSNGVTPTPVPTPVPTPTPTPTPDPQIACTPVPPPIYGFRVKVHDDQGFKKILDSRALIQDVNYCTAIGYPGYSICVVRDENDPQAVSCGNLVTGRAEDTRRYGPTWFYNGEKCRPINDPSDGPGCKNHPSNQFLLFAFGSGEFMACAEGRRGCNSITIP